MDNWKKCKLGDICSKVTSGGTPLTSNALYYNGIIPWLNTKEVKNCRIYETEKYISQLGLENSSAKWIEANSVIIAMYGATAGKVAINKIPLTTNQACCNLTINHEKADYNFIYYLILNNFETLEILATGAAQQNLNLNTITSLEITLPPLEEQRQIAAILSSIDDKIELLHEQNKTLEELAQTLFRHYFIENPNPSWQEKPLKDVCVILNGYAFKSKEYSQNGTKIVRTTNFKNGFIDNKDVIYIDNLENQYDKYLLRKNDFLLVMVGASLGNYVVVTSNVLPALQNQNMWNFRALEGISQHYLNYALRDIVKESIYGASGSAREFFQKNQFYEKNILVPSFEIMNNFEEEISEFYDKLNENLEQIQTLENMRDILIPKLLNGEIKVGGNQ
ncbi:TPA: restriction endonuclease subunit S [Campylobacter coli]|nr:restriction endonuclease subunit S [Campylobacter coli]HEB9335236.1 restriction endonuclease subunit S [Campylobacter coli]